jgi:2-polyprenyl-3-methyl-5-hydroxy-6-metoxy-1,4-benzoquinol methylase
LDVGGGQAIFPQNPNLARALVSRSAKAVAVDPSDNVRQNEFVHERVQSRLEDYHPGEMFDVATLRMVVEHVQDPQSFVHALSRLVRPGGTAVVFTVNKWAPIAILSRALPFRLHHPIKEWIWGSEEKDTFPVHYRMNTRARLRTLFLGAGFVEETFMKTDDLSAFGRFSALNYAELLAWRSVRAAGLHYPENCILAVYRRRSSVPS